MSRLRVKLIKRIARGGMAEIFLGKILDHTDFSKVVAIKRILPHYGQDEEYLQMFRDEAAICKRLTHGNIVQVFSFEEIDDTYALIMEFVNGSDLRTILSASEKQKYRIAIPMALHVAAEIARGLHYAHTKADEASGHSLGIVHRDVSPQNILVSYDGAVKITDFGIADAKNKQTETKPGIVKGKYSYMSPEQVNAEVPDHRSDIFSLAIVLWEMLTMRRLFASDSEIETIRLVQNCRIPFRLRDVNSEVHPDLEAIVEKGLAKDRRRRYQTAQDFERDLSHHLHTHYPAFTGGDLGNYVKRLFPEKRQEIQEEIRQALSEEARTTRQPERGKLHLVQTPTSGPELSIDNSSGGQSSHSMQDKRSGPPPFDPKVGKDSVAVNSPSNPPAPQFPNQASMSSSSRRHFPSSSKASNAVAAPSYASHSSSTISRAARAGQSERRPIPKSETRNRQLSQKHSSRNKSRARPALHVRYGIAGIQRTALLFVALIAISLGVFLAKRPFTAAEMPMTLYLKTTPASVKLNIDGQDLGDANYQQTPIKLTVPPGQHKLRILRQGYLPEVIEFEGAAGSVFREDRVTLRRSPRGNLASVRVAVIPVHARIPLTIDDGFIEAEAPLLISDLEGGKSHTIIFYPNGERRKGAGYRCSIVPQAGAAPAIIRIDVTNRQDPRCNIVPN